MLISEVEWPAIVAGHISYGKVGSRGHNFMGPIRKVSVCGLGKLGACIAATFAQRGFEVVGVDIDPEKVRKVNEGLPPVEEPLLAETIAAGRTRLRATLDPGEAVAADVTFFIPPS